MNANCNNSFLYTSMLGYKNGLRKKRIQKSGLIYKLLVFMLFLFSNATSYGQLGLDTLWTKGYTTFNQEVVRQVQVTSDNGYIFINETFIGGGVLSAEVVKTDSIGTLQWSKKYITDNFEVPYGIVQTDDGGYLLATNVCYMSNPNPPNKIHLTRLNSGGETMWTTTIGNETGIFLSFSGCLAKSQDGGFLVAGWGFGDNTSLWNQVLVYKINSEGDLIWSKNYGGAADDFGACIQPTSDGNHILAGHTYSYGNGYCDGYMLKIDPLGDTIWTKTYGGESWDSFYFTKPTSDNGFISVGTTQSYGKAEQGYVVKADSLGEIKWELSFGGEINEAFHGVCETDSSEYIVTGHSNSFGNGNHNFLIAKIGNDGMLKGHRTLEMLLESFGSTVERTEDGGYITAGTFRNYSGFDAYLLKFAPIVSHYSISASSSANGSIFPSGDVVVIVGEDQAFQMIQEEGYHVSDVLVDGVSVGQPENYTFYNVQEDHTIHVEFDINVYTINSTAVDGGQISPSGTVSLNHGDSQTFTIIPETGFEIADVLVDGVSVGAVDTYTFNNVTANHTIGASFSMLTYTINATAGANGSISPFGNVNINYGQNQTFTITPNTGYAIANVLVDGVSVGNLNTYAFENVTANHTISASFNILTYTINASAGANGSISPSGNVNINYGQNQTFTITPNIGYEIANVLVDGVSLGAVDTYTFSNVTANHTIEASFSMLTYSITASAGANGSISPSGNVNINYGQNQTFTITPNTGYAIANVLVDGVSVGAVDNYTFSNVTANHTIEASFSILTYSITASAGANGSISPSGNVNTNYGQNQTFTITPNTGYEIANVLVDGVSVGAVDTYTFSNVTANHTIEASFTLQTYVIAASSGEGGSIDPSGTITVAYGGSQLFTFTPNTNYIISSVWIDGDSLGYYMESYQFNSVVSNHSIHVQFKLSIGLDSYRDENLQISIYPNPTKERITLSVEYKTQISKKLNYTLLDMQGRMIKAGYIEDTTHEIYVGMVTAGLYQLMVDDGAQLLKVFKVMVEN